MKSYSRKVSSILNSTKMPQEKDIYTQLRSHYAWADEHWAKKAPRHTEKPEGKWIADRGYGTGMALAFNGNPEFIRSSLNFAFNFLLSDKSQVKEQMPGFVIVNTTMENLVKAFQLEGYCMKMQELIKGAEDPMDILTDEDFPADWDERLKKFGEDMFATKNRNDVAKVIATDPMRGLTIEETPEMVAAATLAGIEHAKKEIAKIEFEDFMRHISRAPVESHAMQLEGWNPDQSFKK